MPNLIHLYKICKLSFEFGKATAVHTDCRPWRELRQWSAWSLDWEKAAWEALDTWCVRTFEWATLFQKVGARWEAHSIQCPPPKHPQQQCIPAQPCPYFPLDDFSLDKAAPAKKACPSVNRTHPVKRFRCAFRIPQTCREPTTSDNSLRDLAIDEAWLIPTCAWDSSWFLVQSTIRKRVKKNMCRKSSCKNQS